MNSLASERLGASIRRQRAAGAIFAVLAVLWPFHALGNALPDPVDRALSEAEANADLQLSFTMVFQWRDGPEIVKRFDGENRTWHLLDGDPGALDRAGRAKLKNTKRLESRPGGLVAADYRPQIKQADLVSIDADEFVFRFLSPHTAGFADEKAGKVHTRLRVDKQDGGMTAFVVRIDETFNPNPFVRIDRFQFEHEFERVFADLPPLMTRAYVRSAGAGMTAPISEEYRLLFKDFEKVR